MMLASEFPEEGTPTGGSDDETRKTLEELRQVFNLLNDTLERPVLDEYYSSNSIP